MLVSSKSIVKIKNFCQSNFKNAVNIRNLFERSPETDFFYNSTKMKDKIFSGTQNAFNYVIKCSDNIFNIKTKVQKTIGLAKEDITTVSVSREAKNEFLKYFVDSGSEFEKSVVNAEIDSFGHKGIPLKYTRKKFISDLSHITKHLKDDEKQKIFSSMEMSVNLNRFGNIVSYDGIPTLKNLELSNPFNRKITQILTNFTEKNEALTKDKALNNSMNILLKAVPEYFHIVGKQQHDPQKFSLDGHILKVLQLAMSNNNYSFLKSGDKAALNMMILFHDISKKEGIIDKPHPEHSASFAKNILVKLGLSHVFSSRVENLVKNHHWLEVFNKGQASASDIAMRFSYGNDYQIAKIFAEADLKGVSPILYEKFGEALSPKRQAPIGIALNELHQSFKIEN